MAHEEAGDAVRRRRTEHGLPDDVCVEADAQHLELVQLFVGKFLRDLDCAHAALVVAVVILLPARIELRQLVLNDVLAEVGINDVPRHDDGRPRHTGLIAAQRLVEVLPFGAWRKLRGHVAQHRRDLHGRGGLFNTSPLLTRHVTYDDRLVGTFRCRVW